MHIEVLDVCLLLASLTLWLDNPCCTFKAVFLLASCPQGAKLLLLCSEQDFYKLQSACDSDS